MFDELKKESYEVLKQDMQPYCLVQAAHLDMDLKVKQLGTTENLTESVDFGLIDPSYSTRPEANRDNSDQNF